MATIDIRKDCEEITEIRFSNEEYLGSCSRSTIGIIQNTGYSTENKMYIYKSDIPNLIAALNKAKELGWY